MSVTLTVDGSDYEFPTQGANPPWGEDVQAWASAITAALNNLSPGGDILARSATIANNQSSAADVSGLNFDVSTVRGATILYSVYRTSSTITTPKSETGMLQVDYDGTNWNIMRESSQDTGVIFTITAGGVVQYTSTDVGATSYSGIMSYRAFANSQT